MPLSLLYLLRINVQKYRSFPNVYSFFVFFWLRQQNMDTLRSYNLTEADFETLGQHPEFGQVKLGELLATWVVHDLSHIRQIVRVVAKQYTAEIGP